MTTFLDRLAGAQAKSLITRYGKSVTVKTKVNGTYSTSTGSLTQTVTSQTVKAMVDAASMQTIGGMLDRGIVRHEVLKVSVARAALTTIPALGDAVTVGSYDYVIEHSRPLYTGDDIAVYEYTVSR